jgi:hypothetical protein
MILYAEDWDKYPTAIRDYKTNNKSFLEYARLLVLMGVKNSDFCLALHQPHLSGVNVYSEHLSREIKLDIQMEVRWNPWYYLREVVRIPPNASDDPIPFKANRANISLFWTFFNNIDYFLVQPRQTGKSVSTDCLSQGMYLFWLRNSRSLLITKDNTIRVENVNRLQKMRSYLPEWLVVKDPNDANNQTMLTYNTNKNRYLTAVGQNSEDDANKTGRGASVGYLHGDEGPFTKYIHKTLPAAMTAMNAVRDEARLHGYPNGAIFTTTAGKLDTPEGKYMYEFMNNSADWTERLLDLKDRTELVQVIEGTSRGKKLMILGVWNHRQLGYTDEWLYGKIIETASTGEDADRDYFNRWTTGGLSNPLPTAILEKILKSEVDPEWYDIDERTRFVLKWYIPESEKQRRMQEGRFILGLDTSDAIGNDDCALVLVDVETGAPVASATINKSNLIPAATFVANILVKYPTVTFIPERKSSAQTFIDLAILELLSAGMCPFQRIFNKVVDDRDNHKDLFALIMKRPANAELVNEHRKMFGFITTGASREILYGRVLKTAAKRTATQIKDRKLSGQIRKLEMRNGRIDHQLGGHDDLVVAWLLGQWLLMFGRNLEQYGIDPRRVMSKVFDEDVRFEDEQRKRQALIETLQDEFDTLTETLKQAKDPHQKILTTHRLNQVRQQLTANGGEVKTMAGLDRELKDRERQQKDSLYRNPFQRTTAPGYYQGVYVH